MKTAQASISGEGRRGTRIEIIRRHSRFTEGHSSYWDATAKKWVPVDATMARLYFADGRVVLYDDQELAYFLWLHLPKGTRAAFRARSDTTPVYPWDYADQL